MSRRIHAADMDANIGNRSTVIISSQIKSDKYKGVIGAASNQSLKCFESHLTDIELDEQAESLPEAELTLQNMELYELQRQLESANRQLAEVHRILAQKNHIIVSLEGDLEHVLTQIARLQPNSKDDSLTRVAPRAEANCSSASSW